MTAEEIVRQDHATREARDRVVYVMPSDCLVVPARDELGVRDALRRLWQNKWIVAAITALFSSAGVAYALLATEWFRAEVVLAPAESKAVPDFLGSLGGLASLAGVSIGGGGSDEPVAVLKSREFTRQFIEDQQLLTVLYGEDWDAAAKRWKQRDPEDWPDVRDAIDRFDKRVRTVSVDKKTGMVTLAIRWKDPVLAANWANMLVERLNARMRERALQDSARNVEYLRTEIANNTIVTLQQSIARVLEAEMQRLMLARGNTEFAFRVIDPARPPKKRSEPKRAQVAIISCLLGFAFSIAGVLAWPALRPARPH